jgi:hypothetical protein
VQVPNQFVCVFVGDVASHRAPLQELRGVRVQLFGVLGHDVPGAPERVDVVLQAEAGHRVQFGLAFVVVGAESGLKGLGLFGCRVIGSRAKSGVLIVHAAIVPSTTDRLQGPRRVGPAAVPGPPQVELLQVITDATRSRSEREQIPGHEWIAVSGTAA